MLGYRNSNTFLKAEFERYGEVYTASDDGSVGIKVLFFFNAPLNTIIQSSRYLKFYVPYLTLATLINLLSNVLLLPRYNLFGAVMAMLISEISLVFINLKFIYLIYHPCQNYAPKDPNKVGS